MNYTQRILQVLNRAIKDGQPRYTYNKQRRVVCGVEIGFNVPLGLSYEKALECLPALVATCGHEVELISYKGLIVCRVIEKDWPFPLRFDPKDLKPDELLMGYDRLMQPVYHPLNVHILEGGASGAGKTVWQKWIVYQLLLQGYKVVICDMKGYSFDAFEGLVTLAEDLPSCKKELTKLVNELEWRRKVIKSKERGSKEETIATFQSIVVIIDEAADLAPVQYAAGTQDKADAFVCDHAIGFIGRKGREPKVFCIYGTQRPEAKIINKQFKDNVEASVAFRCNDHYASEIIIDRPGANLISPKSKGRFIYKHGEYILVQTPFIGEDREEDWRKLLRPLRTVVVNGGSSKRKDPQRESVDGSFTHANSPNGSNSEAIPKRLTIETGIGTSQRTGTTEASGVRMVSTWKGVETHKKRIIIDADFTDEV